jgi:phage terminase Nu1 subunit (DNA packaging protein)
MPEFDRGPAKVADFCRLVGISRQRVTTLRQNGQITGTTLAEWIGSYCAGLRERAAGRDPGGGPLNLAQERAALALAQRRKLDREARIAEGNFVPKAQAVASATKAGMAIRDAMLSVPGRVAAQLAVLDDERAIERVLADVIRAELTRLAESVRLPGKAA